VGTLRFAHPAIRIEISNIALRHCERSEAIHALGMKMHAVVAARTASARRFIGRVSSGGERAEDHTAILVDCDEVCRRNPTA
jgi:hypothetical protein